MANPATKIVAAMLQSQITKASFEFTLVALWRLNGLRCIELQIAVSRSRVEMTFDYNVVLASCTYPKVDARIAVIR